MKTGLKQDWFIYQISSAMMSGKKSGLFVMFIRQYAKLVKIWPGKFFGRCWVKCRKQFDRGLKKGIVNFFLLKILIFDLSSRVISR